jgi:hypothetical protein
MVKNLKTFTVRYWYRFGNFDKEFEQIEIIAETEEKAQEIARTKESLVFKTEIIS